MTTQHFFDVVCMTSRMLGIDVLVWLICTFFNSKPFMLQTRVRSNYVFLAGGGRCKLCVPEAAAMTHDEEKPPPPPSYPERGAR
jgi:hypothetical protein